MSDPRLPEPAPPVPGGYGALAVAPDPGPGLDGKPPESYARRAWRRYRRSAFGVAGLTLVLFFVGTGMLAPVLANENEHPILARYDGRLYAPALVELTWTLPGMKWVLKKDAPFSQVTFDLRRRMNAERGDWAIFTPIEWSPNRTSPRTLEPPSREHWLGTDEVGRDLVARMIHGARISMLVGFVSIGLATLIGLTVGSIAGYAGGWIDLIISRVIEIVVCFPTFFLILSIMAWFTPSIWNVMIVIGITGWTGIARYVRGEFLRLREIDFTVAASALGASSGRIIFRHILPNALAPVFVTVTFGIANAILTESALSWLGLGVMPPQASWGNILRTGFENIFTSPHIIYPPCIAIFLAVLSYNLVGDTLRDVVDPRLATR